jgi:hypothetical protein
MSNTPRRKQAPSRKGGAGSKQRQGAKQTPSGKSTGLGPELPWGKIVGWGLGVIVIGAMLAGGLLGSDPLNDVPDGLDPNTRIVADVASGIHEDGDIAYAELLPPGGPHNPIWQNCGFYDGVIRTENAVHSLEHGAVWLTYRSDIAQNDLDTLAGFGRNRTKVLVSEQPLQDSPIVATAWGYQYEAQSADEEGLLRFIAELEGSPDSPEPNGACGGGVSTIVG